MYRAWDSRLDREVALKLLRGPAGTGDARATSIIEEGRLLARVRHPNVVTVYGADRIDGRVGLWMELVRGRTLQKSWNRATVSASQKSSAIGIQLCDAVTAVHARGTHSSRHQGPQRDAMPTMAASC